MPGQIQKKPINRLPAALSSIQGIVDPQARSLLRPGGQVWSIEENQIEASFDAPEQISPDGLNSLGSRRPDSMGIDVRGDDAGYSRPQLPGDKAAAAADLQDGVLRAGLGQGCLQEQEGVLGWLIDGIAVEGRGGWSGHEVDFVLAGRK
jgi:hypothetical protein